MRQISKFIKAWYATPLILQFLLMANAHSQTKITEYVIFGGKPASYQSPSPSQTAPLAPGYAVQLGSSSNIKGGSIGSYNLVKSIGSVTLGTNIFSGGTIQLASGNTVTGKITAANQYTLPAVLSNGSTIFSTGTGAKLGNNNGGNIDVNGSVNIGTSSSVLGKVTLPSPASTYNYTGPTPAGGLYRATPTLPVLPNMPSITQFDNYGTTNIKSTSAISPGAYGDIVLGGNNTVTLSKPGIYIFKSITTSGPNSQIVYNFNNQTGNFIIQVHGDIVLNKTTFSIINGGVASRIFTEIHGTGSTNTNDNTASFYMSNGSNGSGNTSGWMGSIWAPYAAIKIGTPNGPSMTLAGALWSGTQVNIVSGITMTFAPFLDCAPAVTTANAGADQIGFNTCGLTTTTLAANTPTVGTGKWSIVTGDANGAFGNINSNSSSFTGTPGFLYTLRWTISNGNGSDSYDEVNIKFNQNPSKADAGQDQNNNLTCGLTSLTLAANAPVVGKGSWSIVSGDGNGTFGNIASNTSTFSGRAGAVYLLRWTISNSPCTSSFDDVEIKFNQNPTKAEAGPDQTGVSTCGLNSVALAANAPVVGIGSWSILNGDGNGSFGNVLSNHSTFIGTPGIIYTLRWTISNSPCTASSDDVNIKFNQNPINVNAGTDKALEFTGVTRLKGTATSSEPVNYNWAATNGGIITSTTTLDSILVSSQGSYIFTVANPVSGCSVSDTVEVTSKTNKIIGSELQSIFENKTSDNTFFDIKDGYIKIDIIAIDGKRNNVLDSLLEEKTLKPGLKDTVPNGLSGLTITGRYLIDSIQKLNTFGNIINYVRPYYRAILFNEGTIANDPDTSKTGLIRSQGDTTMKTHLVRNGYSIYGDGIKLGVISDSYSSVTSGTVASVLNPVKIAPYVISPTTLDTIGTINANNPQQFNTNTVSIDVTNRELPANVHELPAFPVNGTDEGRAMLQIAHDVAPGAELYFRTGFNTAGDFAKGIKELKDAGCNIIVDDITYPTEPFLRDGIVARTVNEVKAGGLTYFTSAGNFGNRAYEEDFNPINFNGKTAHNFGGGDVFQKIKLAPGDYTFVFQWVDNIYSLNETVGTVNDLDIYLTKNEDGSGLVGFNRNNLVGDPIEFIPITVPAGDSVIYNVFIVNNTPNSTNPRMKYVVFRGNPRFMEYDNNGKYSTIVGQANATGAITVGAARFNHVPGHPLLPKKFSGITKPQIEIFSSVGGTKVNGELIPRQKPDMVGPDGGNTTVKMGQDYPDWALDGYSNFFGTSAAAPHAAAAAALIMEGRKKYLGATTTTPDEIKSLFQTTAVDMETEGFDYISGKGMVDADAAMRTFAAPRPYSIKLVIPAGIIPGDREFLLTVTGQNFSSNSEVFYGDTKLEITYISPNGDTILAKMPKFADNAPIRVYTAPITQKDDGGFSNSLYFFDADIVIRAVNTPILYGQNIPVLDTIITINGKLLQDTTGVTLESLGLAKMKLTTTAPAYGFVGTYVITPSFDSTDLPSDSLLIKYNYQFINAQLSVAKMPLKVTPNNKSIVYGEPLGPVTFQYDFEPDKLPSNVDDWRQVIKLYHETILPNNALAVIKDFGKVQSDGGTLTNDQLSNLNTMISFNALINSGKYIIENNTLVPVSNLSTLNGFYQVDVASESIYNYLKDPATASLFNPNSLFTSKAVLGANALANKTAQAYPNGGGGLAQMVNGMVSEVAGIATGPVVPIINNNLIQVLNAKIVTLVNNEWVPVAANADDSIQIVNNQLTKFTNGIPQVLADGIIVQVNGGGGLAQLVNGGGGLAQLVNGGGGLAQLVNNGVVNSQDLVFDNGVVSVLNGGGGLAQLVNGTLIAFPNGGGGLAQLVNGGGGLAQLVNGGGGLAQLVNGGGGLAQLVNGGGGLAQLVNGAGGGGLAQLVNGGGGLAQLVNGGGGLAQLVNGNVIGTGPGSNNNTAVIFDESNINHPQTGNWLGAMFGINTITGLNVGHQKLVPSIFVNPNFDITYGLADVEIAPATITVTALPDTKDYDGNTISTKEPTVIGLTPTDAIVTKPVQTFDSRNAGTKKVLKAMGLVVNDANNGGNYTIKYINDSTGKINPITATVAAQPDTIVYNGSINSVVVPVVTGLIAPDAIGTAPKQVFDTRNAGVNKIITASGLVINDGNGGSNYTINNITTNKGVINQKPVTVTAKTDSKNYDGTKNSSLLPSISPLISPDAVGTAPKQTFDNLNAGKNKVLTAAGLIINDGNSGNNYSIGYVTNSTGEIKPLMLKVTADNKTRPYGENNPPLTATLTGFLSGESLQNSDVTGIPSLSTNATIASPVGTYTITPANGSLASNNYLFIFVNGTLTVATNSCLITHSAFKNFGSTTVAPTSLWMSVTTKVSGQLNAPGDYLLFKAGSVTFNNINSNPLVNNQAIPNGKIVADATVSTPKTRFDANSNTWITRVPVGFSSTSDIFITGAIINSSNGFVKSSSSPSSVLKGMFYSTKYFKDQWAYAIAAYQPQFTYSDVDDEGLVTSINGTYRAGTPTTQIGKLVNGGSGGGGNNCTGSSSSYDNFTACPISNTTTMVSRLSATGVAQDELATEGTIEVYPNPASNFVTLTFVPGSTGNSKIELYTIDGKKVFEMDNGIAKAGKKYFKRIEVNKLVSGVYMVHLMSNDKVTIKKIIISR